MILHFYIDFIKFKKKLKLINVYDLQNNSKNKIR